MAYPENIVAQFYNCLEARQLDLLRGVLSVNGMKEIIEAELLDPRVLLSPINFSVILPFDKAEQLIKIYSQHSAIFNSRTIILTQMIIWINAPEPYPYVLSEYETSEIVKNMGALPSLRQHIESHPIDAKKWSTLIKKQEGLSILRPKEKKVIAEQELLPGSQKIQGFLVQNTILITEYLEIFNAISQYANQTIAPLEDSAKTYFKSWFAQNGVILTDANIEFFRKPGGGVQLGRKMVITYSAHLQEPKRISYYIKTHQDGSTSETSSTKPVDPKELFVYKLLEYLGLGPKMHYFFNPLSPSGFYIATQDLSYTKSPLEKKKVFEEYQKLKPLYQECAMSKIAILPTSTNIASLPITSNASYIRFEQQLFYINKKFNVCLKIEATHNKLKEFDTRLNIAQLQTNQSKFLEVHEIEAINELLGNFVHYNVVCNNLDENTIKTLTGIDILSRLLRLHDLSTNAENFGRTSIQDQSGNRYKWKIIDFRIYTDPSYYNEQIFEGFRQGNCTFNYLGFLEYLFRDRPMDDRIQSARIFLNDLQLGLNHQAQLTRHLPFFKAVQKASNEIRTFIQHNAERLQINAMSAIPDLNTYVLDIQNNYGLMSSHLLSYPDQPITTEI